MRAKITTTTTAVRHCVVAGLSLVLLVTALLAGACNRGGSTDKFVIGFSQANKAEPWRTWMDDSLMKEAAKHPELEVRYADAQQDNSKQVADVENFLRQRVDLLIISPNEAKPLTGVVKRVYEGGVPVIVLDRGIEGDSYTTFIGADNREIGKAAGEYAAQLLGGKGSVVEIKGLPGSTPAVDRSAGFRSGSRGSARAGRRRGSRSRAWRRRSSRRCARRGCRRSSAR